MVVVSAVAVFPKGSAVNNDSTSVTFAPYLTLEAFQFIIFLTGLVPRVIDGFTHLVLAGDTGFEPVFSA